MSGAAKASSCGQSPAWPRALKASASIPRSIRPHPRRRPCPLGQWLFSADLVPERPALVICGTSSRTFPPGRVSRNDSRSVGEVRRSSMLRRGSGPALGAGERGVPGLLLRALQRPRALRRRLAGPGSSRSRRTSLRVAVSGPRVAGSDPNRGHEGSSPRLPGRGPRGRRVGRGDEGRAFHVPGRLRRLADRPLCRCQQARRLRPVHGHRIVSPDDLGEQLSGRSPVVAVMNENYCEEIRGVCAELGVESTLVSSEGEPI
jgi:hypothetical protein